MQYFEDLEIGVTSSFGRYEVTREEVLEFATQYDPQPFHLDDEAAAKTHFGRLSASGWHTAAMTMRMLVDSMATRKQAGLGGVGVDELRWHKPVCPGDILRVETTIAEKTRSRSRTEMGSFRSKAEVFNQDDALVLSFTSIGLIRVRGD